MADKKTLKQIDIGKGEEKDKTGETHHQIIKYKLYQLCLMSFCCTTNQVIMPERQGKVDKYYVKKRERKRKKRQNTGCLESIFYAKIEIN
jgi:hypothetical protein